MEILYVIGMIAVFVLCLALLSTARRILRATPLSITQAVTSRTYDMERDMDRLEEDALAESSARLVLPGVEAVHFESTFVSTLVLDEPLVLEAPTEAIVLETIASSDSVPSATPSWQEELAEKDVFEQPQASKWARFPKPTRQTYNYALECVLIGVSAWVLIKTQRDALRFRSAQPSHGRVA